MQAPPAPMGPGLTWAPGGVSESDRPRTSVKVWIALGLVLCVAVVALGVGAWLYAPQHIQSANIENSAIDALKIADNAVHSAELADGGVMAVDIAPSAVTADKVATDAITSDKIKGELACRVDAGPRSPSRARPSRR